MIVYLLRKDRHMRMHPRREFLKSLGLGTAALAAAPARALRAAATEPNRPNFLFLFTDDQTFQSIGALNNPDVKTPNIDRLVRRGTTFTHCFNQGSWTGAVCVASRAMLNTGRWLWTCGGNGCGDYPLWGQTLGGAGYQTFVTGKWHNGPATLKRSFKHVGPTGPGMYPSRDPHAKEHKAQGFVMDPYNRPRKGNKWSPSDKSLKGHWLTRDGKVVHSSKLWADTAIDFLKSPAAEGAAPFFMYVSFHAPHDPRQSPQKFVDMYPPDDVAVPPNYLPEHPFNQGDHKLRDERLAPFPRSKRDVQVHRREYYAIISHADHHIGRILDALEASGQAENTIIIFSADHGLAVGQHGLMGKQNQYDHSVRMPLIFAGPGIPKGKKTDALVYLPSVFPTTCEMAGVPVPDSVQMPSLVPILRGTRSEGHESIYGAYRHYQRMVRTDRWKLIRYPHVGKTQLFDIENDPWETTNLAEDPKHKAMLDEMNAKLKAWMKRTGDKLDLDKTPRQKEAHPNPGAPVKPQKDGSFILEPKTAKTRGSLRYQPDRKNLGAWHHREDFPQWTLLDVEPGLYQVEFSYGSTNPGVAYTIEANGSKLEGKTEHTGGIKRYKAFDVGALKLPGGKVSLAIKPGPFKGAIMNFRRLRLTPTR
jgi:choline-sulfatase